MAALNLENYCPSLVFSCESVRRLRLYLPLTLLYVLTINFSGGLLAGSAFAELDTAWVKTYGTDRTDEFHDQLLLGNGRNLITGGMCAEGRRVASFCLFMTDSEGNTIWSRIYNSGNDHSEVGISLLRASDGGYFIIGYSATIDTGRYRTDDIMILHVDEQGDSLWTKRYGRLGREYPAATLALPNGGYAVCGSSSVTSRSLSDGFLLLLDSECDSLGMYCFRGEGHSGFEDLIFSSNENFVLVGSTTITRWAPQSCWFITTDANGDIMNSRTVHYGGSLSSRCTNILETENGDFFISGDVDFELRKERIYTLRVSPALETIWAVLSGPDSEGVALSPRSLLLLQGGSIAMTGFYFIDYNVIQHGPNSAYWILLLTEDGEETFSKEWPVDTTVTATDLAIRADGSFNIIGYQGRDRLIDNQWIYGIDAFQAKVCDSEGVDLTDLRQRNASIGSFIFPNPTNGLVRIETGDFQVTGFMDLRVLDATGRILLAESYAPNQFQAGVYFDFSGYSSGNYFLYTRVSHHVEFKPIIVIK